jgi:NADPH:quinone reductase-like Zn-dependent oxidoreductase
MEVMRIQEFGAPSVLHEETIARPEPGEGEMLVRVRAASVNPVDYKMRSGKYPSAKKENLPLSLGRDLAGDVEGVGHGFTEFRPGDAVFGMLGRDRGAYAEYVLVKANEAAPKPQNLSYVEAAAVPLAGLTAWQGLFEHGKLKAGQRVLIHGGAGGVGHLAIQFAAIAGAHVLTTASDKDRKFLEGLGAELVIDHKTQAFDELIEDPVQLVFDLIGGDTLERSYKLIAKHGNLVTSVGDPDNRKAADHGITATRYMAEPNSSQLRQIGDLIAVGNIVPAVARTFPLAAASQAHEALERDHIQGKIVLQAA